MRHAGTDMRVWSLVFGKVVNAKMSAELKSLQMEQLVESQFGGCLLLKSTIFRMGEGNFAESNWIENLLAERFVNKDCSLGLAENFPSSSLSLAW